MKNKKCMVTIIQTRTLKYFGYIIRQSSLNRTLLERKVNGGRGRGRLRATWPTDIIHRTGFKYEYAVRTTYDRDKWRTIIAYNPQQKDGTND